jgi:hypothetical protein
MREIAGDVEGGEGPEYGQRYRLGEICEYELDGGH